MVRKVILPVLAGVQLAGCAAMSGYPRPAMDPREEDAELAPYLKASAVQNYEACTDKVACRNTLIDARVRAVDLAFYRFQRRILSQEGGISVGSEIMSMGLDSAAALTGTKVLAAGAGLLAGSRDAYQKQVVRASMPLLFEEMLAKRRQVLLRIRQSQMLPIASYSLFQALNDVSEYELAGSLFAASADLQASAGGAAGEAQAKLDALRAAAHQAGPAIAAMPPVAATPLPTVAMPSSPAAMPPPPNDR